MDWENVRLALDWEIAASLAGGVAIAGGIVGWPRPTLFCLGLLSLLLGLLGLASLGVMSIPPLIAILGGIGLIGIGRLIGAVEQLAKLTSVEADRNGTVPDHQSPPVIPEFKQQPRTSDERVEPRL